MIDAVLDITHRYGTSPTRVATAWCLRLPVVNAAIIGTDTPEQVRQNFRDADWELPAEAAAELDRCSAGLRPGDPQGLPAGVGAGTLPDRQPLLQRSDQRSLDEVALG